MLRRILVLLALLALPCIASARDSARGWCEEGNRSVVTSGLSSTTKVQQSHPQCVITVFVHGGGLATIFSDNNSTPLANPFTSQTDGQWQWYADNGRYDVTMSAAGFSQTITYSDIILCDPFEVGSTCNNGGEVSGHNLLSTTHLDTVPFSPPVQGDVITAQTTPSPTGVTPAWSRLPIGTLGQVLYSTGNDAIWGTLAAGTGVTITPTTTTTTISLTNTSITVGGSTCTLGSSCTPHVNHGISFTVGAPGGTALTAGSTTSDYITVPFACTINAYNLAIDAGTITVKFWKIATGTVIPTSGNSINTSGVGISSGTAIHSATLSDFTTTAISANDILAMNITVVSTAAFVNGVLSCQE